MPHACVDFGKEWKSCVFYTHQLNCLQQDCRVNREGSPISPHGQMPGRSAMPVWGDSPPSVFLIWLADVTLSRSSSDLQAIDLSVNQAFQLRLWVPVCSSLFPPGWSLSRCYCSATWPRIAFITSVPLSASHVFTVRRVLSFPGTGSFHHGKRKLSSGDEHFLM